MILLMLEVSKRPSTLLAFEPDEILFELETDTVLFHFEVDKVLLKKMADAAYVNYSFSCIIC